jgi:hypothetical protein
MCPGSWLAATWRSIRIWSSSTVPGRTYQELLDQTPRLEVDRAVSLGLALARACHSLHRQNVVHQDLKPPTWCGATGGTAVLLDFGLSHHAELPDLLAEETRQPIGTAAYMAPEQVLGIRGDSRSDLFAVGVVLLRDADRRVALRRPEDGGRPAPALVDGPGAAPAPASRHSNLAAGGVLRLLEPQAEHRYPSAKHLVFDLENPGQVAVTARGQRLRGTPWHRHLRRWLRAGRPAVPPSTDAVRARSMRCPSFCWRCPTATSATARCTRCGRPPRGRWVRGPARAWPASP